MSPQSLRIVVPRYGAGVLGGSESLARRIARALAARGWRVEAWATAAVDEDTWAGESAASEVEDAVVVRRFPIVARRRPRAFHQASRMFFRLPARVRPEAAWLRLQGPFAPGLVRALTTATTMPTLFTPYLYYPTVYGLPASPHPRLLIPAAHDERPLRLRAVARTIAAADGLWYNSAEERTLLEAAHPAARGRHSAVGTVGVDLRHGEAGRFRAAAGVSGPFLLYGGRVAAGKGFDELLAGFARLHARRPEVRLVLAGGLASGAGRPGVITAGLLSDEAWTDALTAATAVVVPSRLESLSLLALEAWSGGTPCLLNGASPVLRAQAERSGAGIAYLGARGLADAAEALLDDPARARRLGDAGRAFVDGGYRWDDVVQRLTDLIAAASP